MMQTENRTAVIRERIENIYKYLHRHKEYINRLNVFPVPDGDTGLNMTLTLQGALANMHNYEEESISTGEYLKNFCGTNAPEQSWVFRSNFISIFSRHLTSN